VGVGWVQGQSWRLSATFSGSAFSMSTSAATGRPRVVRITGSLAVSRAKLAGGAVACYIATVRISRPLRLLPFLSRNSGLAQDNREKANADIASVGVRNRKDAVASHHELVPSSRKTAAEAEAFQGPYQLPATDGPQG